MRSKRISASTPGAALKGQEISLAKAKAKTKYHTCLGGGEPNTDLGHEVSKAGLGVLLCAGAIIGLSGFFFFGGGLIQGKGIAGFAKGWFAALNGI